MTWDQPWVDQALCAQIDVGDVFFSETTGINNEARRICARCEVQPQCLEYALHRPEWGIWGGKSENERRKIRRERGIKLDSGWGIPHGTPAGARAHYRRDEKPCTACMAAQKLDGQLRRAQ